MGKKILYVILGMIVAIIVIAKSFSNANIKAQTTQIEQKITQKIDRVFKE